MKDNWKQIRSKIIDNVKEIFENSTSPKYSNFDQGVELFKNVLYHKTGIKKLDGLGESVLDSIYEVYITKPGSVNPVENLLNNIEAFLKKIIFITTSKDLCNDKLKTLMFCLKELNLLRESSPGKRPQLDAISQINYKGQPYFLEYVCKAYLARNEFHNAPKLKAVEAFQIVENALVVYLFAILENYTKLASIVGTSVTGQTQIENYRKYMLSVLSYNPSLKMLESDFGIQIQSIDDFEIKIKAKAKKRKEEKDEYMKDSNQFSAIPIKFLPEIDGVMTNTKYILLHGIATSGKSTILKKLGKDFIEKMNSPYLFYFEMGEVFKKKNGYTITQEIISKYKDITALEFNFENINEKILILLDGLDEVPNKESRDTIIQQIVELKNTTIFR